MKLGAELGLAQSMAATFQLTIDELLVVDELPDAWTDQKYLEILERLDIPNARGVPHEELLEMCIMALQDLEPLEGSELTLDVCLQGILKDGQIRNAAHDLRDEALWENYPDLKAHEPLFRGAWLISKAFPQVFPKPQIARVDLRLGPHNEAARKRIAQPLNEATLLRLLAQVMDPSSILLRMFGDQIRGGAFSEAEYLLWAFEHAPEDEGMRFLPARARWAILVASRLYQGIGRRLRRRYQSNPMLGRVVVPWSRKLLLVVGATGMWLRLSIGSPRAVHRKALREYLDGLPYAGS